MTRNIFTVAMGTGYIYTNTMENKVSKKLLKKYVLEEDILKEIEELEQDSYSIWGLGETRKSTFKKIKIDDVAFFTSSSAIVYIGEVAFKYKCKGLSGEIWDNEGEWDYKVLFKNVIKVFIPDSDGSIENILNNHKDIKIFEIRNIMKLYDQKIGFRQILGIKNTATLQSINKQNAEYESVMSRYAEYCLLSNYECLIREVR